VSDAFEPVFMSTGGLILAVILGLLWGSFANVCIYRLPADKSVVSPGSHCGSCGKPVRWYDNMPVISYLWLRGRCRDCHTHFSARYMAVEALTAVLFGVAWWFTLGTGGAYHAFDERLLRFVIAAAFVFVMVVITFIDIDHKLILNKVTYPSIPIAYLASLVDHKWWEGLVGAAVGYGGPWLIGEIYFRVRKREGLGLGDSTLLALVGALLGWKGVVVSLFGGSVLGSIIGIVVLIRAKKDVMTSELPFGPFLAAAAVFYLFAEPWLQLHFRLL
jgi:leader peptidase (prepilin peptidase) / N-methyltransferase